MTAEQFDLILERRLQCIRSVLVSKAKEYATGDRLHNFKADAGGLTTKETPAMVLWGYVRKHIQSVYDMVSGDKPVTAVMVDEKIGDVICYMILLEALLLESHPPT